MDAESGVASHDRLGKHVIEGPCFAIGSGKDIAYGALFAGASAVRAVEAAIAHHAECGGGIDVLHLKPSTP